MNYKADWINNSILVFMKFKISLINFLGLSAHRESATEVKQNRQPTSSYRWGWKKMHLMIEGKSLANPSRSWSSYDVYLSFDRHCCWANFIWCISRSPRGYCAQLQTIKQMQIDIFNGLHPQYSCALQEDFTQHFGLLNPKKVRLSSNPLLLRESMSWKTPNG